MEQEIVKIIVEVVVALLGLGGLYLINLIKKWLQQRRDESEMSAVDSLIEQFVAAADQLLKGDDPTGEKRKQYVIDRLGEIGYKLTDIFNAKIEAAVFQLNRGNANE